MKAIKILILLFFVVLGGCAISSDGVKVSNLFPQYSDLLVSLDFKGSPYYKATL